MKKELQQTISDHLNEALSREDLKTCKAAELLNLNPTYVSMAKNPKLFDSLPKMTWQRLEEWHDSRCKISEFEIPEGELIFQRAGKSNIANPDEKPKPVIKKPDIPPPPTPKPEISVNNKIMETGVAEGQKMKVILDIEINLFLNGMKINLK